VTDDRDDGGSRGATPATRIPRLPPAFALVALDSVSSTMDEARRRAEDGAEDGTLVWALEQTGGRGRLGAGWTSPRGNFYGSLVVRPDCTVAEAAQFGFLAALAIGAAIGSLVPPLIEVTYKWPNDVLVNGKKASGILLESRTGHDGKLEHLIVGTGVNLVSHPSDTRYPATDLAAEECGVIDPPTFLEAYARYLVNWVNRWLEQGFEPVRRAWLDHAAGLSEHIQVRLPNETLSGLFSGLGPDGTLLLDTGEGTPRRISAGEVLLTGSAASPSAVPGQDVE